MLGYSHEEFLGKKLWEVGAFADIAQSKQMFAELQTKGYVRLDNLPLKTKVGKSIDVEFVSNSYSCEGIKVIQCNIRDISDRTAAEAEARLRTRLYTALSACNKAIVHCTSEAELFPRVCRIVVQLGGMRMAWIGLVDPDSGLVRPVASFGDDAGYLQDIRISASADSPYGRGPTGTAVRTNRPVWADDAATTADVAPWSALRARSGFTACGSLPLQKNGVVIGALSVYSGDALHLQPDHPRPVDRRSPRTSALPWPASPAKHCALVPRRQSSRAKHSWPSPSGSAARAAGALTCRTTARDAPWSTIASSAIPRRCRTGPMRPSSNTSFPRIVPRPTASFREFLANRASLNLECRIRRADGELRWIRIVSSDVHDGAGATGRLSGMVQDITERKRIEQVLHESQQRLAGVLHSAMDAIVTAEASGALVLSNPAAARMFGYTRSRSCRELSL